MQRKQTRKTPKAGFITFRCSPITEELLERVRQKRGARSRTSVILSAIYSHCADDLTKRERAEVGKYIKEAA